MNWYKKAEEDIANDPWFQGSVVKDPELYNRVTRVKYTIKNDDLQDFGFLMQDIDKYYNDLIAKYKK